MKQTASVISTYTADVSGVASALYELGGMTVIHDASGCNSTYNTHDEPRWYDRDSYVFISALTEIDAVMGNDEKILRDIERAAEELHPEFIALCGTPIPMMTGFDFEAMAKLVEEKTGVPAFGIPTNGMHTYISGAGKAFACLAERMVKRENKKGTAGGKSAEGEDNPGGKSAGKEDKEGEMSAEREDNPGKKSAKGENKAGRISVNILGATPLDFSVNGELESLESRMEASGFGIVSNWAMNGHYGNENKEENREVQDQQGRTPGRASLQAIEKAGTADVNLVVSSAGLAAAKILQKRFGIPYVTGIPIGPEGGRLLTAKIKDAAAGKFPDRIKRKSPAENIRQGGESFDTVLIYEPVIGESIAAGMERETGKAVRLVSPIPPADYGETEKTDPFLRDGDAFAEDEDDLIPLLKQAKIVIADPMYRLMCPENVKFIPFPHEAFSGRIYRREIPDLVKGIPINWLS